jgi:hypothetical protein
MRKEAMRKRGWATPAILAGVMTVTGAAHATCSDSTIRGDYTFTVHGNGLAPDGVTSTGRFDGVGTINFDGGGNLVQQGFVVRNGVEVPGASFNPSGFVTDQGGTYSVNPDCTGTAVINLAPGNERTLAFVISKAAHTIHAIVATGTVGGNPALVQVYSDFEKIEGRE